VHCLPSQCKPPDVRSRPDASRVVTNGVTSGTLLCDHVPPINTAELEIALS
jgi:hypothetical protein